MRRFFFSVACVTLCASSLVWLQFRYSKNAFVFQPSLLVQSSLHSQDWTAFIPPKVLSISPLDQSQDVLIGIEDPIVVRFASSVKPFFVDFALDPPVEVVYENNPKKTEFRLLPKAPLQDGMKYTLTVSYRRSEHINAPTTEIFQSVFSTLPLPPTTWSPDLDVRLIEAKRFTRPIRSTGKYIDINLSNQVMTLFEEGVLRDAFLVSSGRAGMATPQGEYVIHNKAMHPWSKRYLLYMPYWMAITSDGKYGIHELPEWPGGYKEGANHLGRPVSHGCVRLGVGSAKMVYDWASEGTPVIVH